MTFSIEDIATLAGEGQENEEKQKESSSQAALALEPDVSMHPDSSDLSDPEGGSENGSEAALSANNNATISRRSTARQKDLMQKKAQAQAHAKQRELARQKANQAKQAQAEQRRLEEELGRVDRRLESIEREFRKLLGVVRVRPLGKDRFYNRIWWFDGMGSASLLGSGGTVQYGAGRVFVQGPSEFDVEILERREEKDVEERRLEEEGAEGMLGPDEWGMFTEQDEVEALVSWLNPKGVRELALKNAMTKWWGHISPGMRKRTAVRSHSHSLVCFL
jgi:bromodomain adjacent to zinc finger domain protein 1A